LLGVISRHILSRRQENHIIRVAIDGPDGSGKTMFADKLAECLRQQSIPVIRASVDGFHRPRQQRYRRGRHDPEGFYRDSYDYAALTSLLLEPLGPGGSGAYKTAIRDVATDTAVHATTEYAAPGAVLLVDGIFLHRDELIHYWDYSIFLDVDFATTFQRMAQRDGTSPDPQHQSNRRYRAGQLLYFQECDPRRRASIVIDNTDFLKPRIIW
jgi:uridine kinase